MYYFQFFISALSFATFSVSPELPQNRLQLSFTLLLTSVAFKFVINQSLPKISYLTYMVRHAVTTGCVNRCFQQFVLFCLCCRISTCCCRWLFCAWSASGTQLLPCSLIMAQSSFSHWSVTCSSRSDSSTSSATSSSSSGSTSMYVHSQSSPGLR